jgi:hypothetical protein
VARVAWMKVSLGLSRLIHVQDDRLWGLSGGAAKKQVYKTAGELCELARAGRDRLNDEGSGHRPGAFDSLDIDGDWRGDWRIANILAASTRMAAPWG